MVNGNIQEEDNYSTPETQLAAFLMSIGGKFLHMVKVKAKYHFYFDLSPEQIAAIPHYYDDSYKISPQNILTNYVYLIQKIKDKESETGAYAPGNRR